MKKIYLLIVIFFCCIQFSSLYAQRISSMTLLDSIDAGFVCYPALGQYFCYSKTELDGFYDIYTRNLDGTNAYCWTCSSSLIRNNAHPEWHPSMNFIVFQGEKNGNTIWTHPGFGWFFDLWILRLSDGTFYNIRDAMAEYPDSTLTGVLHPHFSHDGTKLVWSELKGSFINWQNYAIMIADFIPTPTPHLANITELYDPVYGLAEVQGFSFNDDKLLFAGNIDSAQSSATLDLYYLQLNPNYTLQNPIPFPVSKNINEWAEAAKFMPSDQRIIFSTTKTFPIFPDSTPVFDWRKSEYWIVNTDGTNPHR
jgi:Tol biopolymer transport system component